MFTVGTNMSTTSPITLPTTRGSTEAAMRKAKKLRDKEENQRKKLIESRWDTEMGLLGRDFIVLQREMDLLDLCNLWYMHRPS